MNDQYPKYYIPKTNDDRCLFAYVVRKDEMFAKGIRKSDGAERQFLWNESYDSLIACGMWIRVSREEAMEELNRISGTSEVQKQNSIGSDKLELLTQIRDTAVSFNRGIQKLIQSTTECKPVDTITVHGKQMRVGDYYYGLPPDADGVFSRWADITDTSKRPDWCGYVRKEEAATGDREQCVKWFWVYNGPIPNLGACIQKPVELVPGKKYRMIGVIGKNEWTYQFSAEVQPNSGRHNKGSILHWFLSSDGSETAEFKYSQICECIDDSVESLKE